MNVIALPTSNEARASARKAAALWCVGGIVAYLVLARLGMAAFSLQPANLTLLWLPSGVGLLMCLRLGAAALPAVFAASFMANFHGMARPDLVAHITHTAVAAGADALAPWLSALALRRFLPQGTERVADLFTFVALVCLVPTLVSSAVLVGNLVVGGYLPWRGASGVVLMLLTADSLGLLLIYSVYREWSTRSVATHGPWWVRAGAAAGLGALLALAFNGMPSMIYLVLPVLIFLVFRSSGLFVNAALLGVICLTVVLSTAGTGPFGAADGAMGDSGRRMLIMFLFSTTLVTLGTQLQRKELLAEAAKKLEWQHRAGHDALTGLANRQLLVPMLDSQRERVQRQGDATPFCFALLDIDHFKQVNDRYGHAAGDEALRHVAQALKATLRGMDFPARFGGEEFAVVFPQTRLSDAATALERLRERVAQAPTRTSAGDIRLTLSGGVIEWTPRLSSNEDVIAAADARLYRAKHGGRNRIESGDEPPPAPTEGEAAAGAPDLSALPVG